MRGVILGVAILSGALLAGSSSAKAQPLTIVEVGYLPFEQDAANLFFQLVSFRYEHASLVLTSNLWVEVELIRMLGKLSLPRPGSR